jgi:serine/threonine-protein kinase
MVGRFGEVYVMDWGLARVVGQQPIDATASAVGPVVATLRGTIAEEDDASPLLTQHGDVVGTPAYMAP